MPDPMMSLVEGPEFPDTGSLWTHMKSRKEYRVVGRAIIERDLTPAVLYRACGYGEADSPIWVRPVREFMDGRFQPL